MKTFYNTLFDQDDHTCFADSAYGNTLYPVAEVDEAEPYYEKLQYFSINPMTPGATRADANVVKYRNFLIEFDNLSLEDQLKHVKLMKMPYSTVTFSGNKSYHFIISLETPLKNRDIYDQAIKWIYNILGNGVDTKNKNPSRFSRVPGGTNLKTSAEQELIKVNGRIKNEKLQAWIMAHPECEPQAVPDYEKVTPSDQADYILLSTWTRYLLDNGIYEGKRNDTFYKMAYDFQDAGYTLEEALSEVFSHPNVISDLSPDEIKRCFCSAYKQRSSFQYEESTSYEAHHALTSTRSVSRDIDDPR